MGKISMLSKHRKLEEQVNNTSATSYNFWKLKRGERGLGTMGKNNAEMITEGVSKQKASTEENDIFKGQS
ncbi:hypothetical protein CHARACLAT_010075 [Characodon lateralis]|uniref:Uncharacterized protein n=1 Tax=Characodon lateralis TaxID=208331 RepID=A0ABU7CR47_9TELE|nr:hypothetical protein [Characodon lateralis]